MRWQNPVSRAAAAIHTQQQPPPPTGIYTAAAAVADATTIAAADKGIQKMLKFNSKQEKRQNLRQNETHYDNITH